jgi:adenosylhomocysteinase
LARAWWCGEVDPVRAVEAAMDGCDVMPMDEAVKKGDLFITVTGCKDVVTAEHLAALKDGAILCNAGHFDVEVAVSAMRKAAVKRYEARHNIEALEMADGRTVYILAEGRLVNLAAGDGHPAEIMDISFALQALSAEYVVKHRDSMKPSVYEVPEEIDEAVARMKLEAMGLSIDALTETQREYIRSTGE